MSNIKPQHLNTLNTQVKCQLREPNLSHVFKCVYIETQPDKPIKGLSNEREMYPSGRLDFPLRQASTIRLQLWPRNQASLQC